MRIIKLFFAPPIGNLGAGLHFFAPVLRFVRLLSINFILELKDNFLQRHTIFQIPCFANEATVEKIEATVICCSRRISCRL